MKIHHISAGTMCPFTARLVNGVGGWFEPARMVCHCWLIESDDGLILVDTGMGKKDVADVRGRLGFWFEQVVRPVADPALTAYEQIRALGFDPRDVRHLVPTHLDLDHAGGLPDFTEAAVHVFRPEYDAAMKLATLRERRRYRPVHWAHGPRWDLRDADGEKWFGFEKVRAIDRSEEILLIPLVGHTRGHAGVAVRSASGWMLHAGDAYFFHEEMSARPHCTLGLRLFQRAAAMNDGDRVRNQQRLHALVADSAAPVTVHSAHCPFEFDRLSASTR